MKRALSHLGWSGVTALAVRLLTAAAVSAHAGPDHATGGETGSVGWGTLVLATAVVAAVVAAWLKPRQKEPPAHERRPYRPLIGPPLPDSSSDHAWGSRKAGDGER